MVISIFYPLKSPVERLFLIGYTNFKVRVNIASKKRLIFYYNVEYKSRYIRILTLKTYKKKGVR